MSTILKTVTGQQSRKSAKSKGKLPQVDLVSAAQDIALEAGEGVPGGDDADDDDEDVEMFSDEGEDEESTRAERPSKKRKTSPPPSTKASAKTKFLNGDGDVKEKRKDKVLLLSSRGTPLRVRHLMLDLEALLPHVKKDAKLDSKSSLHLINELSSLQSCNNSLYLETRHHSQTSDIYLWINRAPNGPSAKCHVQNIHTMDELKMTGNCLKGSRGLVVFDGGWEKEEWGRLMKEMLAHVFSTPPSSRRLKPFIDHILTFSLTSDNRIWFRNYQIVEKDVMNPNAKGSRGVDGEQHTLVEIGPRFVLTPIRIFEGSFGGPTVFENPEFISPAATRASVKRIQGSKYRSRKNDQADREDRKARREDDLPEDDLAVGKVFA